MNINQLMKQAQQIQSNMQKAQEEIANMEVTGQSGGGMVQVIMTGRHDLKRVTIDPSLMTDDKEMLEDLVAAAVNDAVRQIEKTSATRMEGVSAGFNMPAGLKLPF